MLIVTPISGVDHLRAGHMATGSFLFWFSAALGRASQWVKPTKAHGVNGRCWLTQLEAEVREPGVRGSAGAQSPKSWLDDAGCILAGSKKLLPKRKNDLFGVPNMIYL